MKLTLALVVLCLVTVAYGSSHSEAPGTAKQPQADHTDLYVFRSYEPSRLAANYITFLVNVQGLQSPFGGPNYFSLSDQHFYEIYIDNTGDAVEDIVYQWMYGTAMTGKFINTTSRPDDFDCNFTPQNITIRQGFSLNIGGNDVPVPLKTVGQITAADNSALNWIETYTLTALKGNKSSTNTFPFTDLSNNAVFTKPFDYSGQKTFPDYNTYANQYIYDVKVPLCPTGNTLTGKLFVGQRLESFFINLGGIFDLINFVPIPGFPGAIQQNKNNNDLIAKNIDTFALEVPTVCLTVGGVTTGTIGVWAVIRELIHVGSTHVPGKQVSRLGNPLINELVIGLYDKYVFNGADPINDGTNFGTFILFPTMPEIVNILFGVAVNTALGRNTSLTIAPNTPRNDLLTAFGQGIPGINQFGATAEMVRINVGIAPVAFGQQNTLGVVGGDLAGMPNGRRPGDDAVDIGLQVLVAGVLCTKNISCVSADAPIGTVALTDGAPIHDTDFMNAFPYLNPPLPGALNSGHPTNSPAGGLSVPSSFAIFLALAAGFLISIAFFRF